MNVSKTDYVIQKKMLNTYIGKQIIYQGKVYKLFDFLDITIESEDIVSHHIQCLLIDKDGKQHDIFIEYIFEVCFPQYCKDWSKLPPFLRI